MADRPTLRLHDGYPNTSPELSEAVADAQRLLIKHGYELKPDGLFGAKTEFYVEKFQRENHLEIDGIIGPRTWAELMGSEVKPSDNHLPTTIPFASEAHMRILREAEKYRVYIEAAARRIGVSPSIIAAIGSRESEWGLSRALDRPGPIGRGDHGHGHGLMQIDDRSHVRFISTGAWKKPDQCIDYGGSVLAGALRTISSKTTLTGPHALRAAIASYNCGAGNVLRAIRRGRDVDYYTAGRNYSADVLNRAGWFQAHGWG